jgi:hypothetical protein
MVDIKTQGPHDFKGTRTQVYNTLIVRKWNVAVEGYKITIP